MRLDWRPWAGNLILGGFPPGSADPLCGIAGPHPNGLYSLTLYRTPFDQRVEEFLGSEAAAKARAEHLLAAP